MYFGSSILGGKNLIDKLDTAVPRFARFTPSFSRLVEQSHSPEWYAKVWKSGSHYEKRGDFREISGGELPVVLHHCNIHDRRAGDKIELIETAKYSLSELRMIQEEVFDCDAAENRVLRIDLAADLENVPVQWFRTSSFVKFKRTQREWGFSTVSSTRADTLYAGQKPNQIRIYDKTGHRKMLLASELRRMTRDEREYAMSFEDRWGYSPEKIVTRIERQIGGKQPKTMGIHLVGEIPKIEFLDPFDHIILPSDVFARGLKMGMKHLITADHLREMALRDGVSNTRNYLWRMCSGERGGSDEARKRRQDQKFYREWFRYREFVMPKVAGNVTRLDLLAAFRASTAAQLRLVA